MKCSADDALRWLRAQKPGPIRLYAPGCSGEALIFTEALARNPELAAGITFAGIWIPGVNRTDYAGLHEDARSELIFLSADFRKSFEKGAACLRPLSYTQAYPWLAQTPFDAALLHVSPPDEHGMCSLGVSADFTPAIMHRPGLVKIAHVNPAMPASMTAPKIAYDEFDVVVEKTHPLLQYVTPALPPVFNDIAKHIAALIQDGDTLQFGLGNVQLAVLKALSDKKDLRIHSGMISDPVLTAIDQGVISDVPHSITTGVALGSDALYEFAACDPRIRFAPVSETHDIRTLSTIKNFTAINSLIEVDLFGQGNAEFINGKQVSGTGGLVDFLRGAARSPGGKPITALASSSKNGAISRITPKLNAPASSVARADMGIVVTEYGAADLRGAAPDERAEALIAIAHPNHRATLKTAWAAMRKDL